MQTDPVCLIWNASLASQESPQNIPGNAIRHRPLAIPLDEVVCISGESVDDVLYDVLEQIDSRGRHIEPSRGQARELIGVQIELTDPRSRVSRSRARGKVFSCLGEFIWYLSGSDDVDHIKFYIPRYEDEAESNGTVHAAYGSRLFAQEDRLHRAIATLRAKPDSRQAVVPLLEGSDLNDDHHHVPCTSALQFMLRDSVVDMVVYMRSNDAYLGLPHDIFAFTMLQELVARTVGAELGKYVHMVGSLHLYDRDRSGAESFLSEGYSSLRPMDPMPMGDPWDGIKWLIQTEAAIRSGELQELVLTGHPYWADLARLINAFAIWKTTQDRQQIELIRSSMVSDVFDVFFSDRFNLVEDQP